MDDKRRIAMVENTTIGGSGPPGPQWRFELGNLLDSVAMELHGAVISYEEYHPFGTTGFQSFGSSVLSKKRYRYRFLQAELDGVRNLSTRVRQRRFEFSEPPRRRATSAWVG